MKEFGSRGGVHVPGTHSLGSVTVKWKRTLPYIKILLLKVLVKVSYLADRLSEYGCKVIK